MLFVLENHIFILFDFMVYARWADLGCNGINFMEFFVCFFKKLFKRHIKVF